VVSVVQKSALVKFSAQQMFDLVDDIESYPQFLPWCSGSRVLRRENNVVDGEIQIAKAGFQKAFSTRNTLDNASTIRMSLLDGPFKSLDGVWSFLALRDDASKISLDLEFEIAGQLASLAFGPVFNQICNTMVSSFTQRAKALYGG
jgi:ribosome-associated toxin RatA of RatAB toxin-antitoxin module